MSTHLGLFSTIITFFSSLFSFLAHGPFEYEQFLNRSIGLIDGIITGTTTLGQNRLRSNYNEDVL